MSENLLDLANFKIVSGGQTGADQAALDWAIAHDIPHGGWCPKGRKTEDGKVDPKYQLQETPTSSYLERTAWNVRDSDATIIFTLSPTLSGGSKKTLEIAESLGKPCLHFRPSVHTKFLRTFLVKHNVKVLNVAGPRSSGAPGIDEFVARCLDEALLGE
jgi:hypothetical protein